MSCVPALAFSFVVCAALIGALYAGSASAATTTTTTSSPGPEVSVSLTASISSINYKGRILFPGQVLQYNLIVSNPSSVAAQNVAVSDPLPTIDGKLVSGSVTCGSVPDCTESVSSNNIVAFTLSSVAAGASNLQLSFRMSILPARDIYDIGFWTGGGCTRKPRCQTNSLTNQIVAPPIVLSAVPGNRSYVRATTQITFTVTVLPYAYQAGAPDVVVTTAPIVVDAAPDPTGTTYVTGSASCGTTTGCTASESNDVVTFTFTPASFASGGNLRVTYAYVNNAITGTLTETGSWTGGACPLASCPPQYAISFSAEPGPVTSPSSSTTSTTFSTSTSTSTSTTLSPALRSNNSSVPATTPATTPVATKPSSLAYTGMGTGLLALLLSGLLLVSLALACLALDLAPKKLKPLLRWLRQ